jgi:regulatory protein
MLIHLERIETCGPDRRARRLTISSLDEPRTTAAAVVKALDLEEGGVYDADTFWRDLDEAETTCAKERATAVLGYRERSSRELERRLTDDGYPDGLARDIVTRYADLGLVDDVRFASVWTRSKAAAGMGPQRIERDLAAKGIAPLTAAQAISEVFGDADLVAQARSALRGKTPCDRRERERMIRRLVTRGYSLSTALAAVDDEDS